MQKPRRGLLQEKGCTEKSPVPTVKNNKCFGLFIASIHLRTQTLLSACVAVLDDENSKISNPCDDDFELA